MPQRHSTALALLLLTQFVSAQATPPACGDPTATVARSIKPPETRPTTASIAPGGRPQHHRPPHPRPRRAAQLRRRAIPHRRLRRLHHGDSGCYWADLDAQARRAEAELDRALAERHITEPKQARARKLAIVLDIDETTTLGLLRRKARRLRLHSRDVERLGDLTGRSRPHPRKPFASSVTRRQPASRPSSSPAAPTISPPATDRNLVAAGFSGYTRLITRTDAQRATPTTEYKSRRTRQARHRRLHPRTSTWATSGAISTAIPAP